MGSWLLVATASRLHLEHRVRRAAHREPRGSEAHRDALFGRKLRDERPLVVVRQVGEVLAARLESLTEVGLTRANANRRNRASRGNRRLDRSARSDVSEEGLKLALAGNERVSEHRLGGRAHLAVAERRANGSQSNSALGDSQLTLELDDLREQGLIVLALLLLNLLNGLLDALGLLELGNSRSLDGLGLLVEVRVGSVCLGVQLGEQLGDKGRGGRLVKSELSTVGSAIFFGHRHVSTL